MTRFIKLLAVAGLSSAYLMQAPCTFAGHGFSIFPSIGGLGSLTGLIGT